MFLLIYPFELSSKINRRPLQNTLFDPYWREIHYTPLWALSGFLTCLPPVVNWKQEPWASVHNPQPWPSLGRFLYITIKSWALSGNPQGYTEPPWPSAELCIVPFLALFVLMYNSLEEKGILALQWLTIANMSDICKSPVTYCLDIDSWALKFVGLFALLMT